MLKMLEFVILMIVLDLIMKLTAKLHEAGEETKKAQAPAMHEDCYKEAYVCNNSMAWEFKSLDDAMEFREWRLAGNKGDAIDFYRDKEGE